MIQFKGVSFERGERVLFQNLNFNFSAEKAGLVGANGVGKTTLCHLLAGSLQPTEGRIHRAGDVVFLQQFEERSAGCVGEELADVWGSVTGQDLFADWLQRLPSERRLPELSGGEWMRVRLLKLLARPFSFVILDEPTTHLDQEGRAAVHEFLQRLDVGVLVVSHDRELLRSLDVILELTQKGLQRHGDGFDAYWEERARRREKGAHDLAEAKRLQKQKENERIERRESQEKRMRRGRKAAEKGGLPKIIIGMKKRQAQVTMNKLIVREDAAVSEAAARTREEWKNLSRDAFLRLDFEASRPAAGSLFFEAQGFNLRFFDESEFLQKETNTFLWPEKISIRFQGSQRWHLRGENGSGKSTLLKLIAGKSEKIETVGDLRIVPRPAVMLDQDLSLLNPSLSVLENTLEDSRFSVTQLRNELAFYGFTVEKVHQTVESLSGGEKLRAALAKMFLGSVLPEAIFLDEPTTHLDFQSQELLEKALNQFQGLLVVVSHDAEFVTSLGLTSSLFLRRA